MEEYDPRLPNDYSEATKPSEMPTTAPATHVVVLTNFAAEWEEGLEEDISEECQKFGLIRDIVMGSEPEVQCYVKFHSVEAAQRCREALHGRMFAGRMVRAAFYSESLFDRNELGRL